jgi:signal peptidase I
VPPGGDESQITSEWPMVMQAHMRNGELVVPPESYFGMGDHRDVSLDSRYWGFIPRQNIIGRPLFIYWSFETPPSQYERRSAGERISFLGHVIIHFFDQTRWDRMFHLVR